MLDFFIFVWKMVLKMFMIVYYYDVNINIVLSYGLILKIGVVLLFKGGKLIFFRSLFEYFVSEKFNGFL